LLSNHDRRDPDLSPRLAIVGLSPAATQIAEFVRAYSETRSYVEASIRGAFADLAPDIIAMLDGTGLSNKLGLRFPQGGVTLARHPDVYVTSLVGCATLDPAGGSDDFDPTIYDGTRRCVEERFLAEMLNPRFERLAVVVLFGAKGRAAVSNLRGGDGKSILQLLEEAGKTVLFFPHPSGQNMEYVKLASLPLARVPSRAAYVAERWQEYHQRPARGGRKKQTEAAYKSKRKAVWEAVYDLRWQIAGLDVKP
jgi:hypothetical protein